MYVSFTAKWCNVNHETRHRAGRLSYSAEICNWHNSILQGVSSVSTNRSSTCYVLSAYRSVRIDLPAALDTRPTVTVPKHQAPADAATEDSDRWRNFSLMWWHSVRELAQWMHAYQNVNGRASDGTAAYWYRHWYRAVPCSLGPCSRCDMVLSTIMPIVISSTIWMQYQFIECK